MEYSFAEPWMALALALPLAERVSARFLTRHHPSVDPADEAPAVFHPHATVIRQLWQEPKRELKEIPTPPHRWLHLLWWFAWLLLTLALMGPQKVERQVQVTSHGADLMLAVDVSRSMLALDFADASGAQRTDRLTVVKKVVSDFILNRMRENSGDRYGLVVFGAQAFVQAPLSIDGIAVAEMLNITSAGIAGDATAIGDGVGLAVKQLRERPEGSRVLILLTDGTNNAGVLTPLDAAELAKKYQVRLYAVAVGSGAAAVPFPTKDATGRTYIEMQSMPMDEDALKKMVERAGGEQGGGLYFRATDPRTLQEIYARIDALEKSEGESLVRVIAEPLYHWPLVPGSALMLLWLLLAYRERLRLEANA